MLFPQTLAVWMAPVLPGPTVVALAAVLDVAVATAIWRLAGGPISIARWVAIWGAWLAVTAALVWVMPDVFFGLLGHSH